MEGPDRNQKQNSDPVLCVEVRSIKTWFSSHEVQCYLYQELKQFLLDLHSDVNFKNTPTEYF